MFESTIKCVYNTGATLHRCIVMGRDYRRIYFPIALFKDFNLILMTFSRMSRMQRERVTLVNGSGLSAAGDCAGIDIEDLLAGWGIGSRCLVNASFVTVKQRASYVTGS